MRDGVNVSQHRHIKPVVTASQIMQLENLEAYLKFPGKFPVSKIVFSYLALSIQTLVYFAKPEKKRKTAMAKAEVEKVNHVVPLKFKVDDSESKDSRQEEDVNPERGIHKQEITDEMQVEKSTERGEFTI